MTVGGRRRSPPKRPQKLRLELADRGRPRTDRKFVRRVVLEALSFAERLEMPVSLLIAGDAELAAVHARHLGDDTTTDVISFAMDGAAEVVVNNEMARRVARAHGHSSRAELALYIVHGILHVAGYDDVRVRARRRMRAAEREVLRRLRLVVRAVDA
jgi:probable rRNA maturation factor